MFPIPFNFPFRKKDGSMSTIGAEISEGGGGGYTLPTASASTKGGVKIGSGLTMTGEVLSNNNPTPYELPTASAETLGGIKVGSGLSITDGVLSATGGGGSSKYMHNVIVYASGSYGWYACFKVVSSSSTPVSDSNSLSQLLADKFKGDSYCPASGATVRSSVIKPVVYVHVTNSDTFELFFMSDDGSLVNTSGGITSISDTVEVL